MKKFLPALIALSFASAVPQSFAGALVLDLSTTAAAATPLYGADWNGSAIVGDVYGSNFRDYQFSLSSVSGLTLSDVTVTVKGDIQQNTLDNAVVGVTMWAGSISTNPVFANSLATVFTNAAGLPKNGFFDLALPFGSIVPQASITAVPSIFSLRVWGTGPSSPEGFKVKLASATELGYATNVSPDLVMLNYDGTNTSPAPTFNFTGPTPTPTPGPGPAVPEPGTWAAAALLFATAVFVRLRRRAQTA
jgi:hypothetical protein